MERKARMRKPNKSDWSRKVEARSLSVPRTLWNEAKENTRYAAKDPAFLLNLAREIVLARGPELTRVYRNLVWALPGFKKKRHGRRVRATNQVCIVLVVRHKNLDLPEDHPQHLPRWLLTFAEWEGQRRPFAIPTDVQDANDYYAAAAHADSGIWLHKDGYPSERGSFTCLTTLSYQGGSRLCIMGAMHVFTPFPDGDSLQIESNLAVFPIGTTGGDDTQPALALTLPWGGFLRADERTDRPSLDLQLAEVDPQGEAMLRKRVALNRFNSAKPWVNSKEELLKLGTKFLLLTPDNHPEFPNRGAIRMHLSGLPHDPVPLLYDFAGSSTAITRDVFHSELLRFDAMDKSKVPLPGDSGSPIVYRHEDRSMTLVGMHIGGDSKGSSWSIPAWCCINIDNWSEYPTDAQLSPEDA